MESYMYENTNRLSEATACTKLPQAEAWGYDTISGLRPVLLTGLEAWGFYTISGLRPVDVSQWLETAVAFYLGRWKTVEISVIWASDMPSGWKPMLHAHMKMLALLLRTSIWSNADMISVSTANTPCFSHITTS